MNAPLDAARIASLCHAARHGLAIDVVASTGSTNADLRQRIGAGAPPGGPLLLAAEMQTAGRGRAGRNWLAAPGDSLCFSLAWPLRGPVARLAGLPLAAGVATAGMLRKSGHRVTLKWPNDLLLDGEKLGGILVETAPQPADAAAGVLWVVIGIGINVHANPGRDAGIGHRVAALGERIDRNVLLAALADALAGALAQFDADGLAPFIERWQRWHAFAGLPVAIVDHGRLLHRGLARGIDSSGCLLLEDAGRTVTVAAGDVSLRAAPFPGPESPHAATD
ncbi:MAG: biotin--[acetyl-CoA-carboxylase] ligase [Burkholderiaceae bacterium]|nr:biotin--[acetyl-CoA-carboxylase] ligase [Burkholderiaceae bacterium]